jgi:hypothetical protein
MTGARSAGAATAITHPAHPTGRQARGRRHLSAQGEQTVEPVDRRRRITIIRPLEDFTLLLVADALEAMGGRIVRAYEPPLLLEEMRPYLRAEGWSDKLVVPFDPRDDGTTGLEILPTLQRFMGSHRRLLVLAHCAPVAEVQRRLEALLPAETCARTLVASVDELLDGSAHERVAMHLQLRGGRISAPGSLAA